ncbi:MAG: arsenate reductase [Gloeobacteraceae cyanobacterium ES-bin-316]|nr:arsenate reductase [Ferruginibacter sp.]
MNIKIYGIPNCDTVKKALNWLNKNEIVYDFHDYKKQGISKAKLQEWCRLKGWETIFNKRSTTFKELAAAAGTTVDGQAQAIQLMQQHNSIIKRPIIEVNGEIIAGFNENEYFQKLISHS